MANNLTDGAVMLMFEGEPCPKPIVQVLTVKQLQVPNERFRYDYFIIGIAICVSKEQEHSNFCTRATI